MLAIVTILVVVLASMIVTRVATIALTLTGLSRESARFQARSALTGAGFTTTESESVVTHPIRRRIIMALMLIGSAGVITVIGSLVIGFVNRQEGDLAPELKLLVLVGGLTVLLWLFKIPRVDRGVQRLIRRLLRRYTDLDVRDYAALLHVYGDYSVSELLVEEHHWMCRQTLAELRLNDEGVLVLGVQRGEDSYIGAPKGHHRIEAGDVLVLYGPGNRLEDLDRRPSGVAGTRAHEAAKAEQRLVEEGERRSEDQQTQQPQRGDSEADQPASGDGEAPKQPADHG